MSGPQPWPVFTVNDVNGDPISGAKIYTYVPFSSPNENQITYSNYQRTVANTNPVVTDSRGEAIIYLAAPTWFYVTDAHDVLVKSIPWVGDDSFPTYNAAAYGPVGALATLTAVLAVIGSDPATLYVPPGTWTINPATPSYTIPANVTLQTDIGTIFSVATGKQLKIEGPIKAFPNYQIFEWTGTGSFDLTESPTSDIYIEWFGAEAGITNDCASAITKACASIGQGQWIVYSPGIYRIGSSLSFAGPNDYAFGWKGASSKASLIYIDVGSSNDGVTFTSASGKVSGYDIQKLSFVGDADCCKNAVVLGTSGCPVAFMNMDDVNFFMGSTEYALKLQGCVNSRFNITIGNYGNIFADYTRPALGVGFVHPSPTDYGNNAIEMNIYASCSSGSTVVTTKAIDLQNAINVRLTGTIEYSEYPIYMDGVTNDPYGTAIGVQYIEIDDMYLSDGNQNGPYFKGAMYVNMNCTQGYNGVAGSTIDQCRYVHIDNVNFDSLSITNSCLGVVLNNVGVQGTYYNLAPDTICTSPVINTYAPYYGNKYSNPSQVNNIMSNASMDKWTGGGLEGWNNGGTGVVFTQCGVGKADTKHHRTAFCARMNTNGAGYKQASYTLSADQLRLLMGQVATASMWINISAVPVTYGNLIFEITVPTWASGTAYSMGDCVLATSPDGIHMFKVASLTGDAKSGALEPTWVNHSGAKTTDNHVVWVAIASNASSIMNANMVGSFEQNAVTAYIPTNATAADLLLTFYRTTGGADVNYYIAEPCLTSGGFSPNFYMPDVNIGSNSFLLDNGGPTTTTVTDPSATATSRIILTPTDASTAIVGIYVSSKTDGSFVVTHPASPGAAASMDYIILN